MKSSFGILCTFQRKRNPKEQNEKINVFKIGRNKMYSVGFSGKWERLIDGMLWVILSLTGVAGFSLVFYTNELV